MSARIERLEAELELAVLEEKLAAAKPVDKDGNPKLDKDGNALRAPAEIRLEVRALRQAFREKYREQVNVNPATLGAEAAVSKATASTT